MQNSNIGPLKVQKVNILSSQRYLKMKCLIISLNMIFLKVTLK